MSKADKMLKELGFNYVGEYSNDNELVYFNNRTGAEFYFNKQDEICYTYHKIVLNDELINAIDEKMKELGWIK